MNNTNSKRIIRILTIMIIVLLVANIASLSVIWLKSPKGDSREHQDDFKTRMKEREKMIMNDLALDSVQMKVYRHAKRQLRQGMRHNQEQIEGFKNQIHEQLFSQNPDSLAIYALTDSIGKTSTRIEQIKVRHFLHMRKNLSPEQLHKFRKKLDEERACEREDKRHKNR